MNCYVSGLIGLALLGASFSAIGVSDDQKERLKASLSSELLIKYENIVIERRNIYFQGLILGLILALLITDRIVDTKNNEYYRITLFLLITIGFSVFFYYIVPKSDYMLNHLTTNEQNQAWLGVYKEMRQKYIMGIVLGSLAAIPISMYFCK